MAELSSCDVAWWTTVSLSKLYSDGSGLPHSGNANSAGSSGEGLGPAYWLAQGIYTRIHEALGVGATTNIKTIQILTSLTIKTQCNSNTPSSTQHATSQALGSNCHPACIHWRTGILAKAKELGWCVHELEEVELDELQNLSYNDVRWKFSKVGSERRDAFYRFSLVTPCNVCQPVLGDN